MQKEENEQRAEQKAEKEQSEKSKEQSKKQKKSKAKRAKRRTRAEQQKSISECKEESRELKEKGELNTIVLSKAEKEQNEIKSRAGKVIDYEEKEYYSLFKLSNCCNGSWSARKFLVYMLKFLPLMPISLAGG